MTMPNVLRLTEDGERAINNASAGGIQIKPYTAVFSDYAGEVPALVPVEAQGTIIHSAKIHYIQVLNDKAVRFTMDIPEEVTGVIGDCQIYLEDGTSLAHATIQPVREKVYGKGLRVELILHVGEFSTDVISVELCEYSSIPTVARVEDLPKPHEAMTNVIAVLDLAINHDGTYSPNIVTSYGIGNYHWGFAGWDRVYCGTIGESNIVNSGEFIIPDLLVGQMEEGDLILHAVTGTSSGESRKATYAEGKIKCKFKAFTQLSGKETMSIWVNRKSVIGNSIPPREGIPSDWVLTAGKSVPVWKQPVSSGSGGGQSASLYYPPSKLKLNPFMQDGEGKRTYDMGLAVENSSYLMLSLSGITQHRKSLLVSEEEVTLAEAIGSDLTIMGHTFTHEPSTGDRLVVESAEYVGDGSKRNFKLPLEIASVNDALIYVEQFEQNLNSFVIDLETQEVVFNTAPETGHAIEVNAFQYIKDTGYSTNIQVFNYENVDAVNVYTLPIEPESVDMIFASVSGLHIHKSRLTLSGNKVAISETLAEGYEIEFFIFTNEVSFGSPASDLPNVVIGANKTSKGIELLRHSASPVQIPLDQLNVEGEGRIQVVGSYPDYLIKYVEGDSDGLPAGTVLMAKTVQASKDSVQELSQPIKIDLQGNDVIIEVTANFNAELGEGFYSDEGIEVFEAVCAVQAANSKEAAYGTRMLGTVSNGFSFLGSGSEDECIAYSSATRSVTQKIVAANHKAGYINLVNKCRLANVDIERYDVWMGIEVSIKVTVA